MQIVIKNARRRCYWKFNLGDDGSILQISQFDEHDSWWSRERRAAVCGAVRLRGRAAQLRRAAADHVSVVPPRRWAPPRRLHSQRATYSQSVQRPCLESLSPPGSKLLKRLNSTIDRISIVFSRTETNRGVHSVLSSALSLTNNKTVLSGTSEKWKWHHLGFDDFQYEFNS